MSCLVTVPTPLGIVTPWPVTPSRLSESQGTHASPPLEVRLPVEQSLRGQGVCPLRHWATPFRHRFRCWGPQAPCPMTPHPRPAHFQCSWAGSQTGCGYCLRTHRAWATDTGWPRRALRCGHVHSVMQSCRIETHMPLSWGISQGNLNDKGPNLDSGTLNSDTWSRWSEGEKRGTGWGWVTGSPTGQPTPLGKTQEPKILQADPAFRWVPWRSSHQGQKTRTSPCSEMWAVGLRGHSCFRPCKHRSGGVIVSTPGCTHWGDSIAHTLGNQGQQESGHTDAQDPPQCLPVRGRHAGVTRAEKAVWHVTLLLTSSFWGKSVARKKIKMLYFRILTISIMLCVIFPPVTSLIACRPIRIHGIRLRLWGAHRSGTGRGRDWEWHGGRAVDAILGTELLLRGPCSLGVDSIRSIGFWNVFLLFKTFVPRCWSSLRGTGFDDRHSREFDHCNEDKQTNKLERKCQDGTTPGSMGPREQSVLVASWQGVINATERSDTRGFALDLRTELQGHGWAC